MDFRQSQPTNTAVGRPNGGTAANTKEPGLRRPRDAKWFKLLNAVLLIGAALLVAALAVALAHGNNGEYRYVDQKKYQAVFLNNGQVYFGNIASLNEKYVRLDNIFYLTQSSGDSSSSNSNSNYSLVKLGCQQIHDPYDQMVINRDQVTFWENLQDNGKVVQSINQFKKQNPNGPDCSQVSTQTQASNTSSAQGGSTATPGSSSSTTTKK